MLIIKKGYVKKYAYGGSGLFDSLVNAVTSSTAKQLASTAVKQIATETAKYAGKQIVDKTVEKLFTPKLTSESQAILDKYASTGTMPKFWGDGNQDAIAIQDLVKKLNSKKK